MAIINTNGGFGPTDTVTNTNLNAVADAATFNDPVDEATLELITTGSDSGKLRIKASGVGTTQIASNAVNFSKLTDVNDDDTMSNASATTLATSESIKAYTEAYADGLQRVPAYVQKTLTGASDLTNDSTPEWDPVSGTAGTADARYQVQDAVSGGVEAKAQINIQSGNDVRVSFTISGGTNNNAYPVGLFLERSTDGGTTYVTVPQGDAFNQFQRCTTSLMHDHNTRSIATASFTYIDSPGVTDPIYRVTFSTISRFRLNRDNNETTSTTDTSYLRTVSQLLLEEVIKS
jgi:hypothetical protein